MSGRESLSAAAEALAASKEIALACHIGPDGDALGSMLGLGLAGREAGKKVVASFGSPFVVPGNLAFLPTDLLVAPGDFPDEPETMVILDAAAADRLGELAANAEAAESLIVIDHHVTNGGFGDIAVVDPTAAATGELVAELLQILGWPMTPEIAQCLHTAVVTDTGRFQYSNTSPRVLQLAATLVAAGAQPEIIGRHVYEETPFGFLKAAAVALSRAQLDEDLSMVSAVLTQDDLSEAGIDWGDADGLIDTIRLAREADVAALAKVHHGGRVKMSLRSRGLTDVGSLAAEFGGGGHRLAAGFTFEGKAADAIEAVRRRVKAYR